MNGDAVSYLDMGEELLKSGFRQGYTGCWAPLYGVLAAMAARVADLLSLHRLIGIQALNAVLYTAAVMSCLFFMREMLRGIGVDYWCWGGVTLQLCGLGVFCLLAVRFGGVPLITPDLAVAALVFNVAGRTVRLVRFGGGYVEAGILGAMFGVGYWFKLIFVPLAVLWIVIVGITCRGQFITIKKIGVFVVAWLIVSAPLVVGLSRAMGRVSLGENGRLNYLWHVNRLPNRYWEGDPARHGVLKHPMRKVLDSPPVYEFGSIFPWATYAPWYDPAH
jgi:hypothetical protein